MSNRTKLPFYAAALLLAVATPADAGWVHFGDSIFDAQGETVKHPQRLTKVIVLPTDATGGLVEVCIGYVNNVEKNDVGKVTGSVTITDPDDNVNRLELGGGVSGGTFGECKQVDALPAGTVLEFEFRFKKFKRMRDNDRFQIAAAVAIDGANPFARQAGALSIADQDGIQKMVDWVGSGRGAALRREASGWTIDWRVPGQAFELPRTFRTIAQAVAEWCKFIE